MLRIVFTLVVFCLLNNLYSQNPIMQLDFDEDSGENQTMESISGAYFEINNSFDRPERIDANFGNALRLDGYSTYIKEKDFSFSAYDSAFTISLWYATEAFTKEPGSLIECKDDSGGFSIQVLSYGRLRFTFFFDGVERTLTPNKFLSKYKWHHIVFSVDGREGKAIIYVDNDVWLSHNFTQKSDINSTASDLFIGKSALNPLFAGFSLNTLNGAIDRIRLFDFAFDAAQVYEEYTSAQNFEADLSIDPDVRHPGDHLRPQYHAMPNTSWTNECYGLMYHEGKYHLFFQKNPNGPYLYFMQWGHLSSPDLVTWKEEKIALAPSFGFDSFGVWSGTTTFDQQGNPILFYTGVDGHKAGIGSAFPLDSELIEWQETPGNPIIDKPPLGYPNKDFRDPYIFKEGNLYYMIVGSGLINDGGGILFSYTSTDLENWTLVPPVFRSNDINNHGVFWEMPTMFKIDGENYFVQVTPLYNGKPANSIYWIGEFKDGEFKPHFDIGKPLEYITGNLLAPAFGKDENGQWTYLGIIPEDRDVQLQINAGWRHNFSIPRTIRLLDDNKTIGVIPHPNICRLRMDSIEVFDRLITTGEKNNFPEIDTQQGELQLNLDFMESKNIQVEVYSDMTGNKTKIVLDKKNNRIALDRTQSSPFNTKEDFRSFPYNFNPNNEVKLRVFLDHSTLEVFVDNLISFSSRVYPSEESDNIDVFSDDNAFRIKRLKAFQLGGKEEMYQDVTCVADDLPGNLYTYVSNMVAAEELKVYPNPARDIVKLRGIDHQVPIKLIDVNGTIVNAVHVKNALDVSQLVAGLYYGFIIDEDVVKHFRFIKI